VWISLVAALCWHLLVRPLPPSTTSVESTPVGAGTRHFLAVLGTVSILGAGLAGAWDEAWHNKYGIPFGEDFYWRPHLLLYFSLVSFAATGLWGWWYILSRGHGTLQQRFRSNSLAAFAAITSILLVAAVVGDPLWHAFYGADLKAWSIPHLTLVSLTFVMAMQGMVFHGVPVDRARWAFVTRSGSAVLPGSLALTSGYLVAVQVFFSDWFRRPEPADWSRSVLEHPDWLLSAFVGLIGAFVGALATQATKRIGVATAIGLIGIGTRFAVQAVIPGGRDGIGPLVLIALALLATDVAQVPNLRRSMTVWATPLTGLAVAIVVGLFANPLQVRWFPFLDSSPSAIALRFAAALAGATLGAALAPAIARIVRTGGPVSPEERPASWRWASVIYVFYAAFVLIVMVTAEPPI
jgi:hypothetical protein